MSNKIFPVVIALWFHLFPFRTEKLSTVAPMVLHTRGRVGRRHFHESSEFDKNSELFFLFCLRERWAQSRRWSCLSSPFGVGELLFEDSVLCTFCYFYVVTVQEVLCPFFTNTHVVNAVILHTLSFHGHSLPDFPCRLMAVGQRGQACMHHEWIPNFFPTQF